MLCIFRYEALTWKDNCLLIYLRYINTDLQIGDVPTSSTAPSSKWIADGLCYMCLFYSPLTSLMCLFYIYTSSKLGQSLLWRKLIFVVRQSGLWRESILDTTPPLSILSSHWFFYLLLPPATMTMTYFSSIVKL